MSSEDDGVSSTSLTIRDQSGKRFSCSKQEFINVDFDELLERKTGFAAWKKEVAATKGNHKAHNKVQAYMQE